MKLSLLYFDGCPNWSIHDGRLHEALLWVDRVDAEIDYVEVENLEAAEALSFRGSPTLLIDGRDPFLEEEAPVGLSCRVYRTPSGLTGAPTVGQLVEVLAKAP
ncbi:hypothetical protein SAMN05660662_0214 [Blastococcus aurantiacus]|uniref:Thioredoxin family protein n=1 Tax=Blastococcus aurantiacus TaxID=1550231 RepID=A0A1G7R9Y9_9ACTN|nr:thioredoxin family protein [Blastococcus aurantiacus]SDG07504.1 hypothetical protein SAMN05660662_0214 [Blastococcus aurantiacus]